MTAYNLAKASIEIINLKGKLFKVNCEHKIEMNNLRQENTHLKSDISRMRLSLENVNSTHEEKVSTLKENYSTQHRTILSKFTELYKSKLHEVLDQQSNFQIRLHESQKRNDFLQEQLDESRNKNRILSSHLSSLQQTVPNKPSLSSPLDLTLANSVARNAQVSSDKLLRNKQEQVPTAVLVDVTIEAPLVDIT